MNSVIISSSSSQKPRNSSFRQKYFSANKNAPLEIGKKADLLKSAFLRSKQGTPETESTGDRFERTIDDGHSLSRNLDKLPVGTRLKDTVAQQVLFETLMMMGDGSRVPATDNDALVNASIVLNEVLRSDAVKGVLNQPLTKNGDYPLDLAFKLQNRQAILMLAENGANKIKSWGSLPFEAEVDDLNTREDQAVAKSQLHANPGFKKYLHLLETSYQRGKQSENTAFHLGKTTDPEGNNLLHVLIEDSIPENNANDAAVGEWLKTLEPLLKSTININAPNNAGRTPMDRLVDFTDMYPKTYNLFRRHGACPTTEPVDVVVD